MKKTLLTSLAASLLVFTGTNVVYAQDGSINVVPIEMYTCSYNDQKGPADLDKVIDKWNAWADKAGIDDYAAWTLTPYYFGPDQEFDVIWLGAAKDAVGLGKAQDAYHAEQVGLHADFDEVLTCDAHSNFASIAYKLAPKDKTPSDGVLTFSDCTMKEGASFSDLGAAMQEWSDYLSEAGSPTPIWHWWPAYGGGGEEFDFKWLQAYENLAALGADYDRYGNGGGYMVRGRLLGHLIDCDSSRAYFVKSLRYVQLR